MHQLPFRRGLLSARGGHAGPAALSVASMRARSIGMLEYMYLVVALLGTLVVADVRVEIVSRPAKPLVSWANPVGRGHSPFEKTFNPSYLPPSGNFKGGLLVRLANTSKSTEHIGFVPCAFDNATGDVSCEDLDTSFEFAPTTNVQDPRAFLYEGWYYNFL